VVTLATIGYLEGVDPLLLTRLSVRGVGTLPISNGFDNHGKFINAISERDEIDIVVGHLHKILRTQRQGFLPKDLLQSCSDCLVPILVIVPTEHQDAARKVLGQAAGVVTLVDPERLYEEIWARLGLT
jgi:hypothetical protein